MVTELQSAGQEQNLLLEDRGMDAEEIRIRNEALEGLMRFGNFRDYADSMLYISKRAAERGALSLAERTGTEIFLAMQANTQSEMVKVFDGSENKMVTSIKDSLVSIARGVRNLENKN